MQKITPKNVYQVIEKVSRRAYQLNPLNLVLYRYFHETKNDFLLYDSADPAVLVFPSKHPANWANQKIWCYASELDKLKTQVQIKNHTLDSHEYFYTTQNYIDFPGPDFKKMRKELTFFQKKYNYRLVEKYPQDLTQEFLHEWHEQNRSKKSGQTLIDFQNEYQHSLDVLRVMDHVPTSKAMYVLVDDKLAGLAIYTPLYPDFWVGVVQKVNNKFNGIGKLLYHEKAKRMQKHKFFSSGEDAGDPVLARHKKSLRPTYIEQWALAETGGPIKIC
ncbi:DUF2156 domain-containing protein [Candidatus Uhrbacteria bacterium]|nr:DUF2156 domain-containing protein [Candidatus Uhrbacteria bacterium]